MLGRLIPHCMHCMLCCTSGSSLAFVLVCLAEPLLVEGTATLQDIRLRSAAATQLDPAMPEHAAGSQWASNWSVLRACGSRRP
jgi:hypothetical protein